MTDCEGRGDIICGKCNVDQEPGVWKQYVKLGPTQPVNWCNLHVSLAP